MSGLRGWAALAYMAGVVCIGIGFYTMYTYGDADAYPRDYTGHIVGGDAYNYIIIGVRGVGWMTMGLIMIVLGAVNSLRAGQVEIAEHLPKPTQTS